MPSFISGSARTASNVWPVLQRPGMVPMSNASWPNSSKSPIQGLTFGGKLVSLLAKRDTVLVSCVKTSETKEAAKSNGELILF